MARLEQSVAVGVPEGPRSQVWTVWTQKGSGSAYLRAIRGRDFKVSLHDPAESRGGRAWVASMSNEYMETHNNPDRTPHKEIVRWGPFGSDLPHPAEAVRVLIPSGELGSSENAKPPGADVMWFEDAPAGDVTAFSLVVVPAGTASVDFSGELIWQAPLKGDRRIALYHAVVPMTPALRAEFHLASARLMQAWAADVASERFELGAGYQGAVGLHPLPPEGNRVTLLEWRAGYWMPAGGAD